MNRGLHSIVTKSEFEKLFNLNTKDIFVGLDWSNLVAAGLNNAVC